MFEIKQNFSIALLENIKQEMITKNKKKLLVKFSDKLILAELENESLTHQEVALLGQGNDVISLEVAMPNQAVPIGSVIMAVTKARILGYLPCDGASYNKADYKKLYEAIGDTFGADETTFKVPDLRDEFIRGTSKTRTLGVKEAEDFHALHLKGNSSNTAGAWTNGTSIPKDGTKAVMGTAGASGYWFAWDINYDKAENRPKNIALDFYIKY